MSYKVKSLLYFTCFLASAFLYYSMDNEIENNANKADFADIMVDHSSSLETVDSEDLK
jgi:hypothetical protein